MCLEYDGSSSKHFSSIYENFRIQNLEFRIVGFEKFLFNN